MLFVSNTTKLSSIGYVRICWSRLDKQIRSISVLLHGVSNFAGSFALLHRKGVLDHARNGPFQICIRNVSHFGVVFVHLLDDVAADVDLASHCAFDCGVGEIAGLGTDVHLGVTFPQLDTHVDEVSVVDRPLPLVLHVVDLEDSLLLIEHLDL